MLPAFLFGVPFGLAMAWMELSPIQSSLPYEQLFYRLLLALGAILFLTVYNAIRLFLVMYKYKAWLKSFDEGWEDKRNRRMWKWSFPRRSGQSVWPHRGITQTTISIPLRTRGDAESSLTHVEDMNE